MSFGCAGPLTLCTALSVRLDEPNGEPEGAVLAFAKAGPKSIEIESYIYRVWSWSRITLIGSGRSHTIQ